MKVNFNIQFNKPQQDMLSLIDNPQNKYILAAMSRQIGKSVLCKVLCTKWLLEPNKEIGYLTPTLKLSKKFFNDLTSVIPESLLVKSNASDLVIQSITGSTLYFYSAEQGNRIRGNTFDYLILDEAAFYKEDTGANHIWYSILQPTIKVKGKKIIMVSTPNGCQGFWYDLIQKAIKGTKGYSFIKRTIYDDSMCQDIEEIRNSTPDLMWRQEYLVEFIAGANSFFTGYHNCYDDTMTFNWIYPLWGGIDWSSTGKDETIVTFINGLNQIIQYNIEGDLDSKYSQIASILNKYSLKGVYAEDNSIGSVMINELKKQMRQKNVLKPFTTTNDSKTEIVTELALAFEKEELTYNDLQLDRQLGAFGYSVSKTKKLTFEGKGEHDDRCMSLALALKAKKDMVYYSASNFAFAGR